MADTRDRLIDAATRRFYRDGFRNTGLDAILADVGISKTAFYKHFESKDALMVGVLEQHDGFVQRQFRDMVRERGGRSAGGQLRAIMDVVQQFIADDGFHGCIFVNAVMEYPLPHDPVHVAATRHKKAIEDFVFELAERAQARAPAVLAEELCLLMEGAYVTRTTTDDPKSIGIARRLADHVLERHLPRTPDATAAPVSSAG
jgi:AcrR family transcriptional regulator